MGGRPYNPCDKEFLLNHGRSAIVLALFALDLPNETGVGVLAYNCHTVMNAVEQAGCVPVFIDVKDDLTIDVDDLRRKRCQISALVVTHLFGIVNNVESIRKEFPDLIIIEDCAHAFGIEMIYGDFVVYSFGQGKLPSIGDGGLLVVINEKYKNKVLSLYEKLPSYSIRESLGLFMKMELLSILHRPWLYGWFTLPLKQRKSRIKSKEVIRPMKMCKGISAIYAVEKRNIQEVVERRKSNAQIMTGFLRKYNVKDCFLGCNAFMLVAHCENPAELEKKLHEKGIDSATHFANSIRWAAEFGYKEGQCPHSEYLVKHLLMIPTY